ncbi:MAG: site-specific tyrosine recombinase XerC [Syntrophorhabdus sp. PtaU1.Bin153]|nr:MAG: site-specific tyrosine recombinase XerC [Syntrophorhabdus sp. PtaU1.Bin153]
MSKDETMKVISAVPSDHQLAVKLIYGSGLRLMECLRLHVKDIDFGNNNILIRDAKGKRVSKKLSKTVQGLLDHKDVSTTIICTHVLSKPGLHVKSPLDE